MRPRPHALPSCARLAVVAALGAACGDPAGPADVADTYVLRSIAGDALPAVAYTTPGFTARVVADTLRLRADGTGSATRTAVADPPAPGAGAPYTTASGLSYAVVGGRVEVTYACPPNANCVAGPHLVARRGGAGLVVERALAERVPQVYERVGVR